MHSFQCLEIELSMLYHINSGPEVKNGPYDPISLSSEELMRARSSLGGKCTCKFSFFLSFFLSFKNKD